MHCERACVESYGSIYSDAIIIVTSTWWSVFYIAIIYMREGK